MVYPENTPSKVEKRFYLFSTEIPVPNNPSMALKHHPSHHVTHDFTLDLSCHLATRAHVKQDVKGPKPKSQQ